LLALLTHGQLVYDAAMIVNPERTGKVRQDGRGASRERQEKCD
jgi:hypothetical protein